MSPRGGLDAVERRKMFFPYWKSNTDPSVIKPIG
jgi:hypothetical protein